MSTEGNDEELRDFFRNHLQETMDVQAPADASSSSQESPVSSKPDHHDKKASPSDVDVTLRKYLEKALSGRHDVEAFSARYDSPKAAHEQEEDESEPLSDEEEADEQEASSSASPVIRDQLQQYLEKTPSERQAWSLAQQRHQHLTTNKMLNGGEYYKEHRHEDSHYHINTIERLGSSIPASTDESDTDNWKDNPTDFDMLGDNDYPSDVNSMTEYPEHHYQKHTDGEEDYGVDDDLEVSSYGEVADSDAEDTSNHQRYLDIIPLTKQESWLKDVVVAANPTMSITDSARQQEDEDDIEQATNNKNCENSTLDGTKQHSNHRRVSFTSVLSEGPVGWPRQRIATGVCIILAAALFFVAIGLTIGFSPNDSDDGDLSSADRENTGNKHNVVSGNGTAVEPTSAPAPTLPPIPADCPPDVDGVAILGNNANYHCEWLRGQSDSVIYEMCTTYWNIPASCTSTCRRCERSLSPIPAPTIPNLETLSGTPTYASPTVSPTPAQTPEMSLTNATTLSPTKTITT